MNRKRIWLGATAVLLASVAVAVVFFKPDATHTNKPAIRIGISEKAAHPPLPQPEANVLEPLAKEDALARNASLPFSEEPLEAAAPFKIGPDPAQALARTTAIDCLTAAVYYEANSEGEQGERAVAQVVLNRVRHPAFPSSVCGVVYQGSERTTGCQFTFTCDGSLLRPPNPNGWARAKKIATEAFDGKVDPAVGMATHYHANYVVPYWAPKLAKIAALGQHIFYRWDGYWGKRAAFSQRYSGEAIPEVPIAAVPALSDHSATTSAASVASNFNRPVADLAGSQMREALDQGQLTSPLRADSDRGTLKIDESGSSLKIDDTNRSLPAGTSGKAAK